MDERTEHSTEKKVMIKEPEQQEPEYLAMGK